MTKGDFNRFAGLMAVTAESVDKEVSGKRIAVYFDDLLDLDIRAVEFAFKQHRRESEFFPRVAKLRELAKMWKAPALPTARETKLLETPEITEDRRQENLARVREIKESLGIIDVRYGTSLRQKVRDLPTLEAQRRQILGEG